MDDDMNMQVDPVMMPGTPAPQNSAGQMQQELDQISVSEKEEAKKALIQLLNILQQMVSQGASDEEIEAFLKEAGVTMEELMMAREMFGI